MHMLINKKAVSTFILIILMLCCAVFGAFLSYMWVMANFYLEPEDTIDLVITEVDFPVDHADYFYVTVMNPSHSPSDTNITQIYLTVDGKTTIYNITDTYPEVLPIPLKRGTSETIKCKLDWGEFAGKALTVHVSATNASGAVKTVETSVVKLVLDVFFNALISCKEFTATVRNHIDSAINLTLTKVLVNLQTPENMTITLPKNLNVGGSVTFTGFYNWENLVNPVVRVETAEGYYVEKAANANATISLLITNVAFNETNPNKVSITLFNSADSATLVDVTNIALTYAGKTDYINGSRASPPLPYRLRRNSTETFNCDWNWTDRSYRDVHVTITAYTTQGFVSQSKIVRTPSEVIAKITDVKFDLEDTEHFVVNVTNMLGSLYEINVTKIMFNQNLTAMNSSIIAIGNQALFTCRFNWTSFLRENITITVYFTYDQTEKTIPPYYLTLPYYEIKEISFSTFEPGNPYVNITVYNNIFSKINATIMKILIKTENRTYQIDGTITNPKISPNGYTLIIGKEISLICPWDWNPYLSRNVTVIVQSVDGFEASRNVQV